MIGVNLASTCQRATVNQTDGFSSIHGDVFGASSKLAFPDTRSTVSLNLDKAVLFARLIESMTATPSAIPNTVRAVRNQLNFKSLRMNL